VSATPRPASPSRGPAPHPSGDERFALVDNAIKRSRFAQDHLIEILHVAQGVFGYLSPDLLLYVSRALRLPASRVYGVATFYHLFTFDPPGDHTCTVCTGTACYVKGAEAIVTSVGSRYGVAAGNTTDDGRFTLSTARCLGSCGLAPVAVLDGEVRGPLDADAVLAAIEANLARDATTGAATPDDGSAGHAADRSTAGHDGTPVGVAEVR
jgi:bidirectional [NiFe] hydrogenase diaphorase subunit